MKDRILKHVAERDAIIEELKTIMGYCDESPLELLLDKKWEIIGDDELHIQTEDEDLEDNYFSFQISSLGASGKEFFMGEKDGISYIMAHDDESWEDTAIFILDNKNKVE